MKVDCRRLAVTTMISMLAWAPVFAQHDGHQTPAGTPDASSATVSSCAQGSQAVTRTIDAATARVEDARQTNDMARMRAAVADLQVTLAQMKTQVADCVALSQGGAAMGSMAGMDHSKMNMAPAKPSAPAPKTSADGGKLAITLQSQPTPPRAGGNQFEVTLDFFMPAMPSMKMPERRSSARLTSAGNGVYRGKGSIGMAGQWDVTVVVMRGGQRLGSKQTIVTVR